MKEVINLDVKTDTENAARLRQAIERIIAFHTPETIRRPSVTVDIDVEVDGNRCWFTIEQRKRRNLSDSIAAQIKMELAKVNAGYRWPLLVHPFTDAERRRLAQNPEFGLLTTHTHHPKRACEQVLRLLRARGTKISGAITRVERHHPSRWLAVYTG